MDWTIGHLDKFFWTIFWDQFFVDRFFGPIISGGGEGERKTIST